MAVLSEDRIGELLAPFLADAEITPDLLCKAGQYLDLLVRWNARTNLTAVREPEAIVQRQMGESLLAAQCIPHGSTVLDFGSGGGFPGIPLQMLRPDLQVTLAESQGKKASFLREAVRRLGLSGAVWAGRVEVMPAHCCFDVVVMRAVDHSGSMLPVALKRVAAGGSLLRYVAGSQSLAAEGITMTHSVCIPFSDGKLVSLLRA